MDIERIMVRMTADATQYLQMFDMVEARLVAFGGFMAQELLRSSLNLAMQFERMAIAFEVMTGSAEAGKKVLNDIVDLAMRTPFTTQELIQSGKQAMAFGIEMKDVIPVLERLGAVSIATGADMDRLILAFGQVRTVGRLMGQELRQFTNAGVPMLQYLARAMKVAEAEVPQLVRMGRVGFNDVAQAINLMTSEGGKFFGMLDRTNLETLFGRWQNFTEGVQKTSGNIGKAIIKAFDLNSVVGGWAASLNNINFDQLTTKLEFVRDVLFSVYNLFTSAVDAVKDWAAVNPELATVIKTVVALGAAAYALSTAWGVVEFALGSVILFFTPLATMLTTVVPLVWGMITAVWGLVAAFAAVVGWPVVVVAGFVALVGVLLMMIGDLDGLKKILKEVAIGFGELVAGLAGFTGDAVLGTLEQVGRSLMRLYNLVGGLSDLFGTAGRGVFAAFSTGDMELGFKILLETVKLGFKALWEWVKLEWDLMWNEIFIGLEIGLKRAFFNSVAWLALQVDKVMRHVPGVASKEGAITRDRDMVNAMLDAERMTRFGDAAKVAQERMDALIDTLNKSPQAMQIRRDAAEAQFLSSVGTDATEFYKQFTKVWMEGWGSPAGSIENMAARRLFQAPVGGLGGAAGPAAVAMQTQFERLLMDAITESVRLGEAFDKLQLGQITRQQYDAAKASADAARRTFVEFRSVLDGTTAAAAKAANAISHVFETSAATRAYMLDLGKDFDKGFTALEKFSVGMSHLEEAVAGPLRTLDRRDAAIAAVGAAGILGNRQMVPITEVGSPLETLGLFKEYQNLRRAIGNVNDRRPPVAMEGSREAAEIIGRHQTATLSVQEQIHADLVMANEIHRQQRDYMQQVADEIRRRRAAGMPVPLPLPGGNP